MKKVFFVVMLLAFAAVQTGRADDVVYNNLGGALGGTNSIGSDFGPLADSFSTGSTAFDFTNLTVSLEGLGAGSSDIVAYLLTNNPSDPNNAPYPAPGTALDTIGSQVVSGTISGSQLISFSTSLLLDADTRYWIELTSNNNNVGWDWTGDTSGTGVESEFLALQYGSGVWTSGPNDPFGPFMMEVSGAVPTPEPSTIVLLLVGMAVLLGAGMLRKRNSSAFTPA